MEYKPIDIARKLNISTSTLRIYEDMGIIPSVKRTGSGYRIFTQIHLDYFICIRKMVKGYSLEFTGDLLKEHIKGNTDKALWMITKSQADLYAEKMRLEKVGINLIKNLDYKSKNIKKDKKNLLTIKEISKITDVSITTIRYWETIGLISSVRGDTNNYRLFNEDQIKVILIIHALKYSLKIKHNYYNMEMLKKELKEFIYNEPNTRDLIENINLYLDKVNLEMIKAISVFYELISKDYG
ncbi:MerR family DNA-binding transcriptional regulator [Clostridium sp. YIM B02515]|uniref:MerR family DNA-binding transcriptional regulator n=1 Tax=Clostridium rhizosphaerae TaxID=2803861 RepID=A0ABS1T5A2_9CLOT|nr:MerR family DNA-binding transcriptional regulator [Clostridium rhizosphaerae]MBL4934518.1 MerR family DNA-binding transcriptional regulator [Clostridium rhizosphaerae]